MSLKIVTWALALSGALLYLLCIAYGLTNPASGHMREFLTIALPGFEWLTVKGFVIGLAKRPIYNALQRRFGT